TALPGGALVVGAAVEVPVVDVAGGPPPPASGCASGSLGGPAGAGAPDDVSPADPPAGPGVGVEGAPGDDSPPLPVAAGPSGGAPPAGNAPVSHGGRGTGNGGGPRRRAYGNACPRCPRRLGRGGARTCMAGRPSSIGSHSPSRRANDRPGAHASSSGTA